MVLFLIGNIINAIFILLKFQVGFSLDSWVKAVPTEDCLQRANLYLFGARDSENSDLQDLYVYQVIGS